MVGPMRRSRTAAVPSTAPTAESTNHQPDVAGTPGRVDVGRAEQDRLHSDRRPHREDRTQAAQQHAPEDEFLDERRGDHGGDEQRHEHPALTAEIVERFGVARHRDVEGQDRHPDGQLTGDRRQPGHRAPTGIGPSEPEAEIVAETARAPAACRPDAVGDHRSVAGDGRHGDVGDDGPTTGHRGRRATGVSRAATPP